MAARSIASLTLGFGLVSIPVKLYSATESGTSVRFNLLAPDGARVKQQYVSERDGKVVTRAEMVKGYEVEKDRFVLFAPEELKALEESSSHVIDIMAFIPEQSVDPLYYDKAYLLAPDKRGGKPYALLGEAMRTSGRCALARWKWKAKQYVVQVRAVDDGLVLQQLLYADEVRSLKSLDIEKVEVTKPELQLALQLIDQIAQDGYDPAAYVDEEKQRVLAAIDAKIAGRQVVDSTPTDDAAPASAQVIDLMAALQASLSKAPGSARKTRAATAAPSEVQEVAASTTKSRKGAKRAATAQSAEEGQDDAAAPARTRTRKSAGS